jgi:hypothetical protein
MPFVTGTFVGVGQTIAIEPASGHVLATGRMSATGNHSVLQLDPVTGAFKALTSIAGGDVLGYVITFRRLFPAHIVPHWRLEQRCDNPVLCAVRLPVLWW